MKKFSLALLVALPMAMQTTQAHEGCPAPMQGEVRPAAHHGVLHVSSEAEYLDALKGKQYKGHILKFSTDWCGACKVIVPAYEELAQDVKNADILFVSVNATATPGNNFAKKYKTKGYPYFVFIKDGNVVNDIIGANEDLLRDRVKHFRDSLANGRTMQKMVTRRYDAEKPELADVVAKEAKLEAEVAEVKQELAQVEEPARKRAKRKMAVEQAPVEAPADMPAKQQKVAVPAPGVKELRSPAELEAIVSQESKPVVVKVYSENCGHCKAIKKDYDKHAREHGAAVVFTAIEARNLDQAFLDKHGVMGFPTLLAFKNGAKVDKHVGSNKEKLDAFVKRQVNRA